MTIAGNDKITVYSHSWEGKLLTWLSEGKGMSYRVVCDLRQELVVGLNKTVPIVGRLNIGMVVKIFVDLQVDFAK
jgi:hypothetical protein